MKNRLLIFLISFAAAITLLMVIFLVVTNVYFSMSTKEKSVLIFLFALSILIDCGVMATAYYLIKKKKEDIRKSFDNYIEEQISSSGVGMIIFNNDNDIIWISSFIEHRMKRSIIGKKIYAISPEFEEKFLDGKNFFKFESNGIIFEAKINFESRTVVLKDVTNEDMVIKQYVADKFVMGELDIDNYQQFQVTLSEEELFKIQSHVIKMLDSLVEKYNFIYRQYVNGKYIFFTNQESLDDLIEHKFDFLDEIRKEKVIEGINLTVSMGLGAGTSNHKELTELARDGLRQAQARGGDQVAVMEPNKKPSYYGSKIEIVKTVSRVKIKQTAELFDSRLSNPDIKTVIVYGHSYADLDAIGAAMGVADIARAYKKEVYIQNVIYDTTTTKVISDLIPKDDQEIFIKPAKANKITDENSIVVIVDTAELNRIENSEALKKVSMDNVFVFDHHRVSKLPLELSSNNVYIDTSASSASEIVAEIIGFMKINVKPSRVTAQMMLNGIYLDTKSFTKSTSARTYQAASFLEQRGAQSSYSSEALKIPEEAAVHIAQIMNRLQEVKPGYFLAAYESELAGDVVSMAADEILRTKGRKAAFVIAKTPGKAEYKLSARGIETNVQKIAEEVGGGGHFGAAAATSNESFAIFVDNVRQAIVSKKGDE